MFQRTMMILAAALSIPIVGASQVKPKVSKTEAEQTALAAVNGGKIISGEYEKENGKHIWSFDVSASGILKEVWVDPVSGMVIKITNESIANEKKESATETESGHGHQKETPKKWKVTKLQAENIAIKAVPGGKVMEAELEHESGMYIWSLDVKKGNQTKEVWINPMDGRLIKVSTENEKKERRAKY